MQSKGHYYGIRRKNKKFVEWITAFNETHNCKIKSQDYEFNTQVRVPLQISHSFKENLKIEYLSLRSHYEEQPVT
jgi:hypothetical protein